MDIYSWLVNSGARPVGSQSPLVRHLIAEQANTLQTESKSNTAFFDKPSRWDGCASLTMRDSLEVVLPRFELPPHIQRSPLLVSSAISQRAPEFHELEAVNIQTGTRTLVGERLTVLRDSRYSLQVFPSSVRVLRPKLHIPNRRGAGAARGKINAFSWRSRRRAGFNAANPRQPCRSQFGLTYHNNFPQTGEECKKHLNAFLTWFRRVYPKHPYLWVFEFQSRGAPHFHLFLTVEPKKTMQFEMARAWNRITCESLEHEKFHNHEKNFVKWRLDSAYVTKYLTKQSQKHVPDEFHSVGRFWANSRDWVAVPAVLHSSDIVDSAGLLRHLERYHSAVCVSAARVMKRSPHRPVWRKKHTGCFAIPRAAGILSSVGCSPHSFAAWSHAVVFGSNTYITA